MNNLQALTAARAIIAKPENWCRNFRTDENGAHCAYGALDAATGHRHMSADALPLLLFSALPPDFLAGAPQDRRESPYRAHLVADYNNTRTHAEVLAMFDRAIERERTVQDLLTVRAEVAETVG